MFTHVKFIVSGLQCGGMSSMLAIASLVRAANATGRHVRLVPHSPYFGPGLLATLHFLEAA